MSDTIQNHLLTLARVRKTGAPVISCYLLLDQGRLTNRDSLKGRLGALRHGLTGSICELFDEALDPIATVLAGQLSPDTRSIALFSRAGEYPLFVFLEFQTVLQEWITAGAAPDISQLVELEAEHRRLSQE